MKFKLMMSIVLVGTAIALSACNNTANTQQAEQPELEVVESTPVQSEPVEMTIEQLYEANEGTKLLDEMVSVRTISGAEEPQKGENSAYDFDVYISKTTEGRYVYYAVTDEEEYYLNPFGLYYINSEGKTEAYTPDSSQYQEMYTTVSDWAGKCVIAPYQEEKLVSAEKFGEMIRVTTTGDFLPESDVYKSVAQSWEVPSEGVTLESEYDTNYMAPYVIEAIRIYLINNDERTLISEESVIYGNDVQLSEQMESFSELPIE